MGSTAMDDGTLDDDVERANPLAERVVRFSQGRHELELLVKVLRNLDRGRDDARDN